MAITVATPQLAYVATIEAGTLVAQSSSITSTINITGAWEIRVPFKVQFFTNSADPIVNIFRTTDGGLSFGTVPLFSFSIPRVTGGATQRSFVLQTGMYAVQFLNSGPGSNTFFINTSEVVTAYLGN